MKRLWILPAIVLALAACKKDEGGTPAPSPTTAPSASASGTPSGAPTPAPTESAAPTASPSGPTGSVSMDALAGSWGMQMGGKMLEGSKFELKPDGSFDIMMVDPEAKTPESHTMKGNAKLEGDVLVLTLSERDGKPATPEDVKDVERMKISPDGKMMTDEKGQMTLIRQ